MLVFVLLLTIEASAQYYGDFVAGNYISYTHIGGDTFKIRYTVYRDCGQHQNILSQTHSSILGSTKWKYPILDSISGKDVTDIYGRCSQKSKCAGGTLKHGVEEYVFEKVVVIDWDSCENLVISAGSDRRAPTINTYSIKSNGYSGATLNKCKTPNNSSPILNNIPSFFVSEGGTRFISHSAYDPDGDMLTYSFWHPSSVDYPQYSKDYYLPWSYKKPLSFWGFPNGNAAFPAGLSLDSTTGILTVWPTDSKQETIIGIKITQWRYINGTLENIGETKYSYTMRITSPNNVAPITFDDDKKEIAVCSLGGTVCKDIPLRRVKWLTDSVEIEYRHDLQNITFTNVGTSAQPTIRVCYTPTTAELSSGKPLQFTIRATVNSCPLKGIAEKTFEWAERPPLPDSFVLNKKLICRDLSVDLKNTSSSTYNTTVFYKATSQKDTLESINIGSFAQLSDTGWYTIKTRVVADGYCSQQTYTDSVFVPISNFLNIKATNDTVLCGDPNLVLKVNTTNGNYPLSYRWNASATDTFPSLNIVAPKGSSKYFVTVTDTAFCSVSDSINVQYYNPQVLTSGDTIACANDIIEINALLQDTINPQYGWLGFTPNQTQFKASITNNRLLTFILRDGTGCTVTKTHFVLVHAPEVKYNHKEVYCASDTITLLGSGSGGLPPYNIYWETFKVTGNTVLLGVQKRGTIPFITKITDAFGCVNIQNSSIRVNPTPFIYISGLASVYCESADPIQLDSFVIPKEGVWSGLGVDSSRFYPAKAGAGNSTITYNYEDGLTGCKNQQTISFVVETQPVASFVVDSLAALYTHNFVFTNTSVLASNHSSFWDFGDPNSGWLNTAKTKNATHIFSDTGIYNVKLVVSGGICPPDTLLKTDYITVNGKAKPNTNVLVKEINKQGIKIYPNPASDIVKIETEEEIAAIIVYDMLGKKVWEQATIGKTNHMLEVKNIPQGIYTLNILLSNGKQNKVQVIINK